MEFTRPRGTRDFLFTEMRERKEAESTLRNVFENYGFQEIKTPLFEELKLFTTKSGEEIVDQLYNFKDKSDRELALRPELTAPVARLYLNELQKTTAKPIKLYYYGSCFRYERPQKGRFRQFWQFGCELIGAKSPEGEAEVISMCNESLESLGITPADININHLGIIRGLFAHFNIDTKTQREIMVIIDKGDKELLRESLVGDNPVIDNEELNNELRRTIRHIMKMNRLNGQYTHELAQLVIVLAEGVRDQHLDGNITRAITKYRHFESTALGDYITGVDHGNDTDNDIV